MFKRIFIFVFIFLVGSVAGYVIYTDLVSRISDETVNEKITGSPVYRSKGEVIGFLPYWLITKADKKYEKYLTTLSYFSLSIDDDGSIQKFTKPGETEPGYLTLTRGKMDSFLDAARENGLTLSLVVFSADDERISAMLEDPEGSAKKLTDDVTPILKEHGFNDLNLDIEQVADASPEARLRFTRFVGGVRNNLSKENNITLSIDVVASSFIRKTNLVDPESISPLVDKVIVMAYDYHHIGSFVTGPIAPGEGGGTVSEFDTQTAVKAGLTVVPPEKLILGIPLYGYEWETIRNVSRSGIIPGTGITMSNRRAEELLLSCASCSAVFDETDKENYIIYKNENTGNYHQAFFPDKRSTEYKTELVRKNDLAGLALWALGYEGDSILEPLSSYRD